MISLFRREKPPLDDTPAEGALEEGASKGQTPSKGRATPARPRRTPPVSAPANNKEARERMKERGRSERAEKAEGVRRGDDKYLYPRDAGPARRLVRDVVDSRRGVGPAFFAGTLVVAVASSGFMPETVRGAATGLWLALILFFLVDSVYLSLRLGRLLRERHPDEARGFVRVRHTFYGIMRSLVFRRIRNPAPAVKLGDSV